jgi:hypothetical protein
MKTTATNAPTDQEAARRDLLREIKEEQLDRPWSSTGSEIVDLIDEVTDDEA